MSDTYEDGKVTLYPIPGETAKQTYLAQTGDFTDQTAEYGFTVTDSSAMKFMIGLRTGVPMEYFCGKSGVYVIFQAKGVENGHYLAVYSPTYGYNTVAQTCDFIEGHDYTIKVYIKDGALNISVTDKTAATNKNFKIAVTLTNLDSGNFMFYTFSEMEVSYKMPYETK